MKLFIPPLRTKLRLLKFWEFPLHWEYRNREFFDAINTDWHTLAPPVKPITVALESDTVLAVDRIYIRKGQDGFDSVTFTVVDGPNKALVPKKRGGTHEGRQLRFWVKLEDANNIDCELVRD